MGLVTAWNNRTVERLQIADSTYRACLLSVLFRAQYDYDFPGFAGSYRKNVGLSSPIDPL